VRGLKAKEDWEVNNKGVTQLVSSFHAAWILLDVDAPHCLALSQNCNAAF